MRKTVQLASLLAFATLAMAAPTLAQQERSHITTNGETRIVDDNGSRRLEIRTRGDVEFNDAGDWVASVPAGGLLTVEERDGGERRIEFRPGSVRYYVNDRERPLDADGRAWAQRNILRAVRESGLGAERRVARTRARGGVNGVLQEIAQIRNDTGRRMYYRALLNRGALSTAEFTRVMDDVGRRMGSDVETRLVLTEAVAQASDGDRLAALLRAAQGIDSDVETRLVLNQVSSRHRLTDAAAREAFFRVVSGMNSDVERRLVLNAVADAADGPSRESFFRAVNDFDSDVERRLVLSQVLRGEAPEATVIAAIQAAGEMSSDTEKRLVLSAVPSARLRSARVAAAYRRLAQAMSSDTERRLAMRRLDGGR
jgi:hypothetical protein